MKVSKVFFHLVLFLFMVSCHSTKFYQLYEVKADATLERNDEQLFYENEHGIISYHLWDEHGDMGFKFYNKLDEDIYLSLNKSFFILNGVASPYNASCSSGVHTEADTGDCYLIIPKKAARYISKFNINDKLIRHCDLYLYPSRSGIKTVNFDSSNSPLVFSNRLVYEFESQNQSQEIENNFYVAGITNYAARDFLENSNEEICNQKLAQSVQKYKYFSADKFFLIYFKNNSRLKH